MLNLQLMRLGPVAVALAMALVACASPPPAPTRPELTKIRVADVPIVTQVPFYVAIDRGYFRDAGYEVELVPCRATADAVSLVVTGQEASPGSCSKARASREPAWPVEPP